MRAEILGLGFGLGKRLLSFREASLNGLLSYWTAVAFGIFKIGRGYAVGAQMRGKNVEQSY
jgi:hypothetical protein